MDNIQVHEVEAISVYDGETKEGEPICIITVRSIHSKEVENFAFTLQNAIRLKEDLIRVTFDTHAKHILKGKK